jgi:hypothetical protein
VIRVNGCVCLQSIFFSSPLERVSFNQHDRELLMVKNNSDTIIRRRVDLKEASHHDPLSSVKEISCLGSRFFGARGLTSEDKSLFMERVGLFVRESDLISQYEACGVDDGDLRSTLLKEALRSQYREFIRSAVPSPADVHVIFEVISSEYFDGSSVDYLLFLKEEGISFAERSENGETMLMHLGRIGHVKTMECLVSEWSPGVNVLGDRGQTALLFACHSGHLTVCELLLSHGAQVIQADNDGATPLSAASLNGHASVCDLLLSHGAPVNRAHNDGSTPLFIASRNGHASVCDLLLSHGAQVIH